jgi:tripartite-type tricarboxylate transporter receptor subunit TctC
MNRVRRCARGGCMAIALMLAASTFAQPIKRGEGAAAGYPSKPIRLVVPAAPGGGTDIIARLIGQGLTESWGQSVVVDNRGGGGGVVGVPLVTRAVPDGHTMLLGSNGHLCFAMALYRKLPYDTLKDLTPISLVANQPFVVAVHPSLPAGSIKEFIALAKSRPGGITYASGGSGGASHLGAELLQLMAGISMVHVPYKGSGPGMSALLSGEVQLLVAGIATVLPHIKTGRTKALAVTGAKRAQVAPDLPTVSEAGVPGFKFDVWYGLMFPAGTPRAISMKASAEVARVLKLPATAERFSSAGLEPVSNTPAEFTDLIKREIAKWQKVVQAAGIKVE